MKQNLYKIIAIGSILLGALGPQVASGKNVEAIAPANTSVVSVSLNVTNNPVDVGSIDVSTSNKNECNPQDETIRLDFLLWQGCSTLAIAPVAALPSLAVVSEPVNSLSLETQPKVNYNQPVSISAGGVQENYILPVSGLALRDSTLSNKSKAVIPKLLLITQISPYRVEQLNTVMMRC